MMNTAGCDETIPATKKKNSVLLSFEKTADKILDDFNKTRKPFTFNAFKDKFYIINSPDSVTLTAGYEVGLLPGFEVKNGAHFHGYIKNCTLPIMAFNADTSIIAGDLCNPATGRRQISYSKAGLDPVKKKEVRFGMRSFLGSAFYFFPMVEKFVKKFS